MSKSNTQLNCAVPCSRTHVVCWMWFLAKLLLIIWVIERFLDLCACCAFSNHQSCSATFGSCFPSLETLKTWWLVFHFTRFINLINRFLHLPYSVWICLIEERQQQKQWSTLSLNFSLQFKNCSFQGLHYNYKISNSNWISALILFKIIVFMISRFDLVLCHWIFINEFR